MTMTNYFCPPCRRGHHQGHNHVKGVCACPSCTDSDDHPARLRRHEAAATSFWGDHSSAGVAYRAQRAHDLADEAVRLREQGVPWRDVARELKAPLERLQHEVSRVRPDLIARQSNTGGRGAYRRRAS